MVPITEKYEKRSLQAVHTVFALSEYTRLAVEPIAGAGKVLLAPCGVDTELFRPSNCPSGDYIVSVARFTDPRKNVRLLLDAYAKLNQEMTPIPDLYLVGDLPTQDVQLHIQKFGIANRVRLIGPKQGEELAELYRNASFFVLSSDEEGLAIVILEAMASGLPVISTDCGGPRTSVLDGQTGFLTPLNDASAMAERMERLVRDPALRVRMGEEGRRLAKDRFSLPVTSDVFLRKYDELLNQGAGSQ
jgi:glycosyltransferase involved in cell wall biosynthesis